MTQRMAQPVHFFGCAPRRCLMKPANNNSQKIGNTCAVILFGALALVTTVACSDGPKAAKASSKRPVETAQSGMSQPLVPAAAKLETVAAKSAEKKVAVERPKSELMTFKSRDYGVS